MRSWSRREARRSQSTSQNRVSRVEQVAKATSKTGATITLVRKYPVLGVVLVVEANA
jgi:hypothetical protein